MRDLYRDVLYRLLALGVGSAVVIAAACTESRVAPRIAAPTPTLDAALELSDSAPASGDRVIVTLRLRGTSAARIASFTGRVTYDSTRLHYVNEISRADGATRVSNPGAGLVRVATLKATGLADGIVAQYRFEVVDPRALSDMRVGVDEIHSLDRADASRMVTVQGAAAVRP